MENYKESYNRWESILSDKANVCFNKNALMDAELLSELHEMENDEAKIEDAFYKELKFGTAGLRGVIGAGTNRINVYIIARATMALAQYVKDNFEKDRWSVAISYDSRHKSELFSKVSSCVLASQGVKAFVYKELMPTPCLSYAVRYKGCAAGIMVTASHNAGTYNGYKVYDETGCQITEEMAEDITNRINAIDCLSIEFDSFENLLKTGLVEIMEDEVYNSFCARVLKESLIGECKDIDRNVSIVYSPLCGTGLKPVKRVLKMAGFENVFVVPEQEKPNGDFKTCEYPNPENRDALSLGISYAEKTNADIVIATDPDCDRVGVAVRDNDEMVLISGNEMGALLLNFICELRTKNKTMPKNPVCVKTIVSTELAASIAEKYGVKLYDVLTGFKYIGDVIKRLEENGEESSYIFGFEESYGYLSGSYVRDKDAVDASLLIAEMFAYYKSMNMSLVEKLCEIYREHGYRVNKTYSFAFEGVSGFNKMREIMSSLRNKKEKIGDYNVIETLDYLDGIGGLPKSDVIRWKLDRGASLIIRPSGTEPKIKAYVSVCEESKDKANACEKALYEVVKEWF